MGQTRLIGRRGTTITTQDDGTTCVQYHNTIVVSFTRHTITLYTGGWRTVTTRTRMNQTAKQFDLGFHVYQKDFQWFVVLYIKGKYDWDNAMPYVGNIFIIDRVTGNQRKESDVE